MKVTEISYQRGKFRQEESKMDNAGIASQKKRSFTGFHWIPKFRGEWSGREARKIILEPSRWPGPIHGEPRWAPEFLPPRPGSLSNPKEGPKGRIPSPEEKHILFSAPPESIARLLNPPGQAMGMSDGRDENLLFQTQKLRGVLVAHGSNLSFGEAFLQE